MTSHRDVIPRQPSRTAASRRKTREKDKTQRRPAKRNGPRCRLGEQETIPPRPQGTGDTGSGALHNNTTTTVSFPSMRLADRALRRRSTLFSWNADVPLELPYRDIEGGGSITDFHVYT